MKASMAKEIVITCIIDGDLAQKPCYLSLFILTASSVQQRRVESIFICHNLSASMSRRGNCWDTLLQRASLVHSEKSALNVEFTNL